MLTRWPAFARAYIGEFLDACGALLVPLDAHPWYEGCVPSRLYDAMAAGRCAIVLRGESRACDPELDPE